MTSPLLPPTALLPDLPRERLAAALDASGAGSRPLRTLFAPGGLGKTCGLRAWWSGLQGPRAWLTVAPDGGLHAGALDAALRVAHGGWLVVDAVERLGPAAAAALARELTAPAGLRVVLSGRHGRALPLAGWRAQGLVAPVDAAVLRLDAAEWAAAGLPGEAEAWGGWWGARLAAGDAGATGDPELAGWLAEAWLDDVTDGERPPLLAAALVAAATPPRLAALCGWTAAEAERWTAAAGAGLGPLACERGTAQLPPRLRGAVLAAFRARDARAVGAFVAAGVSALLRAREDEAAAEVALAAGPQAAGAGERVLAEAGWRLLFAADRALLRGLLDRGGSEGESGLLELAWRVEADRAPHLAHAPLEALLARDVPPRERGAALALSASVAAQYDEHARSAAEAAEAQALLGGAPHPAAALATWLEGGALVELGRLAEAEPRLRRALGAAVRDGLPRGALEAWHRLAHLAAEREDAAGLSEALAAGRALAGRFPRGALADAPPGDALARAEAAAALERLDAAGARRALEGGVPAASTYGAEESFPHRTLRAALALVEGDDGALAEHVAALERSLGQRFLCLKWRAEALPPRLAWRARRADGEGLLRLVAREEAEPWPDGIRRDHRAVALAAGRLLAGEPVDTAALLALAHARRAGGAAAIASRAELVAALATGDDGALLAHVRAAARSGHALPYLWLAPRSVGPLEALLSSTGLSHDDATRTFLRAVVQRLVSPPRAPGAAAEPPAPPPGELTAREWEILQLVGGQLTNEQIAARLSVSLATVKTHLNRAYAKLGIGSRAEAVHRARVLAGRR